MAKLTIEDQVEKLRALLNEKDNRGVLYKIDAQDLANKSGVSLRTISNIRGGSTPNIGSLIKITNALGKK